jgi:hypothetical protein
LIAIPSLRLAFAYFPPKEREKIAERIVGMRGRGSELAHDMVRSSVPVNVTLRGVELEARAGARASRYALTDDLDGETKA